MTTTASYPAPRPTANGELTPLRDVILELLDRLDDEQRTADLAFAMEARRSGWAFYRRADVSLRELVLEALGVER